MICFAFAVPHEGEELIKHLTDADDFEIGSLKCVTGRLEGRHVLIAFIGMGMQNATYHMDLIFQFFRLRAVVLAGYGGALVPQLKKGQIVLSENFTSEEVLSFLKLLPGFSIARFVTADEVVATPERKAQYVEATQSQVVDMETAAVAEQAVARQLPFIAVRVISDQAEETLPAGALAAAFDMTLNRPTPTKLVFYFLTHPGQIKPFKAFVQSLPACRHSLTQFILQLTEELPKSW